MSNASWAYVAPTPMDINTSSNSQWNTIPRFPNSTLSSYYAPCPWTTIGGAGTGAGAAGGPICPFSSTSALYDQPPPPYPTPPHYLASSIHPSLSTSAQTTSGQAGTETDFAGSFLSGSGLSARRSRGRAQHRRRLRIGFLMCRCRWVHLMLLLGLVFLGEIG